MKIILALILMLMLTTPSHATLTAGIVPVTKTGGSSPVLQNGSITDTGTASGAGNVGIGSTNPGTALDVQGDIRATSGSVYGRQVFNVRDYGATGNGVMHTDGTITNGGTTLTSATGTFTANDVGKVISIEGAGALTSTTSETDGVSTSSSQTFTSASAPFVQADVNDIIQISGAGPAGGTLTTTIDSVQSSSSITLHNAASTSGSGESFTMGIGSDLTTTIASYTSATSVTITDSASSSLPAGLYTGVYVYGTDDSTAIQAAVNAGDAVGYSTIYFPSRYNGQPNNSYAIYIENKTFSGTNMAQIAVPLNSSVSATIQKTMYFVGDPMGSPMNITKATLTGSVIYSTALGNAAGQAVIGSAVAGTNNYFVQVNNLTIIMPTNGDQNGINYYFMESGGVNSSNIGDGVYDLFNGLQPTNISTAITTPTNNNNGLAFINNVTTWGTYNGITLNENGVITNSTVFQSVNCVVLPSATHIRTIEWIECVRNQNNLYVSGAGAFTANMLDVEHHTAGWNSIVYDIYDPSNLGQGDVTWREVTDGVGIAHTFILDGASLIRSREVGFGYYPWPIAPGNVGIAYNGNVGINTVSPDGVSNLVIEGSNSGYNETLNLFNSSTSSSASLGLDFLEGSSLGAETYGSRISAPKLGTYTSAQAGTYQSGLNFYVQHNAAFVEPIAINNNSNVGIGTGYPLATLDVWGTVGLNHAFQVNSSGNVGIGTTLLDSTLGIKGTNGSASVGPVVCIGKSTLGQDCIGKCTSISTDTCGCTCL